MIPRLIPRKSFMRMDGRSETNGSTVHDKFFWSARLHVAAQHRFVASDTSFKKRTNLPELSQNFAAGLW